MKVKTKVCKKCGIEKPRTEFRSHPTCLSGRGSCRKCASDYTKRWRKHNLGYRSQWEKENDKSQHRRIAKNHRSRIYSKQNPVKRRAVAAMNRAVKRGELKRLSCRVCGQFPTHGHHSDYSKPLSVIWLCPKHHVRLHIKRKRLSFIMNLILPERQSHYYRVTDQGIAPFYEMRGKNGKMRAPKIDDARELGLLVSISRIAGMLPKPALNAWLQSQAIISALTLNRQRESFDDYWSRFLNSGLNPADLLRWCYDNQPNYLEPLDVFAQNVVADMEAQSQVAMGFGTRLHAQIEQELLAWPRVYSGERSEILEPYMTHVRSWIENNVTRVIGAEQIVGDLRFGIGGKLDLLCELNMPGNPMAVVDIKTQGVKNGRPAWYPEWFLQLAGYGHCVKEKGAYEIWPQLISVVVDSKSPGPVHIKNWGDPEYGWEVFLHCLEIFCYVNNYRPGKL